MGQQYSVVLGHERHGWTSTNQRVRQGSVADCRHVNTANACRLKTFDNDVQTRGAALPSALRYEQQFRKPLVCAM